MSVCHKGKISVLLILFMFLLGINLPAFAAAPAILSVMPDSLAKGYSGQVSIEVTAANTHFQLGKSTVQIVDMDNRVWDYAEGITDVAGDTGLTFTLNPGLPTGEYSIRITTGLETVTGGSLIVRGTPQISAAPDTLGVGYNATEMTISGVNTGFNEQTTVSIYDADGRSAGTQGSPAVADKDTLIFTLAKGLEAGTYTVQVKTGDEIAETGLEISAPRAFVLQSGIPFTAMPAGYFNDYSLVLKGDNTNFKSSTVLKLYKGSIGGTDKSSFLSHVTVTNSENISFKVLPGLEVGRYVLAANTDGQEVTDEFEVVVPQISQVKFLSDLAQGTQLAAGYKDVKVELYGQNTAFQSGTAVTVDGSSEWVSAKTVESTIKMSVDLVSGLTGGNHTLTIDMDGDSLTQGDRATVNFSIISPGISSLSQDTIVNASTVPVTLQITGLNTHFTKGSPQVDIQGTDTEQILGINVTDDTHLTFMLRPHSITATGDYDVVVRTVSSVISETARGNGLLSVVSSGISSISPGTVYTDELGTKVINVTGLGTQFDDDTQVYVNGQAAACRAGSATQLTLTLPDNLSAGSHEIRISDRADDYYTSIAVAARSISLSTTTKQKGYGAFTIVVYGSGVTFDTGLNKPAVSISGYGKISIDNANIHIGQFAFVFPAGLQAGNHAVSVSFPQGIYSSLGTLSANISIENAPAVSDPTQPGGGTAVDQPVGEIVSPPVVPDAGFKDIRSHWAKGNIEQLIRLGAINGYADGTFKPNSNITRAEFAKILAYTLGLPMESQPVLGFGDNGQIAAWAKPAVAAVVKAGIVNGYADDTFKPQQQITRAEIAIMVARALNLQAAGSLKLNFGDAAAIPDWAKGYVGVAVKKGIITGYEDNTFRAGANATRAEAVTMIVRMLQNFNN